MSTSTLLLLLCSAVGSAWLWHRASLQGPWWLWAAGLGLWVVIMMLVVRDSLQFRALRRWVRSQGRMPLPTLHGRWLDLGDRMVRWDRRRKRQRDAQAHRLQAFLHALQDAPFGLVLLGENNTLQWCNLTAAQHLLLHPRRDVMQRIAFIVRSPSFVQLLQAGEGRIRWQAADGLELEVLLHVWQANQRLLLTRDISEEQRLLTMQKDFVAHVSHEIRTPLTVLLGFAESLQGLPLTELERSIAVHHMQAQGRQMLALVDDLLQLARLEAKRLAPKPAEVDVLELFQRCVADALLWQSANLVKPQQPNADTKPAAMPVTISMKGLAQQVSRPAPRPSIYGNAQELQCAIGNLLRNALRYAPTGSAVQLCWSQNDDYSTIAVRDQGAGIAPWHIARLGEPFYRIENGHAPAAAATERPATGQGGTGLGLTIVRQIARRHEGELLIASQPQKGSTFSLRLPRRAKP